MPDASKRFSKRTYGHGDTRMDSTPPRAEKAPALLCLRGVRITDARSSIEESFEARLIQQAALGGDDPDTAYAAAAPAEDEGFKDAGDPWCVAAARRGAPGPPASPSVWGGAAAGSKSFRDTRGEDWPRACRLRCWSCTLRFGGPPRFIPRRATVGADGRLECEAAGVFCSFPCVVRHLLDTYEYRRRAGELWAAVEATALFMSEATGRHVRSVDPAPPRTALAEYGGPLTPKEFRAAVAELEARAPTWEPVARAPAPLPGARASERFRDTIGAGGAAEAGPGPAPDLDALLCEILARQ